MTTDLKELKANVLPKVILHEHIEGSVTPDVAKILAEKYHVQLAEDFCYPKGEYDEADFPNGRYQYDEHDFMAFVHTYDKVADLVRDADDYYLVLKDYLKRNAEQGMVYCEMISSAFHMSFDEATQTYDSGKYHAMMDAMQKAINEIEAEYGTVTRLHACGVRHLDIQKLNQSVDFVTENPRDIVTGFNIAGNEAAGAFGDFAYLHQKVEASGLAKSYHAGEICGPQSVIDALDAGATRIGHGIRSIDDEDLIKRLIAENITLEVSPTSNRILVSEMEHGFAKHPLRRIYEKGIRLSINTDDAGIFGTDVGKEYRIAASEFGFARAELLDVTLCALEAAFVDESIRQDLIAQTYASFTEQDWQQLEQICADLAPGALRERLVARLAHARA